MSRISRLFPMVHDIARRLSIRAVLLLLAMPAMAWSQTKATIRLDWVPGAEHAFVYYGKEKGYFRDEGIDLDILPGQGSTVSVKLVGNGDNDFAFADATTLVRAWEAGLPLVALHVLYPESPMVLVFKADSGVKKIGDICAKKVGAVIASTTYAQFKAMLKAAGVTCEFQEIPTPGGGQNEFMAGQIDAVHTYSYLLPVYAKLKGVDTISFYARDYFKLYSQALITNTGVMAKGDLAQRFQRAAILSLREALSHPDQALAAFEHANPAANMEFERAKFPVVAAAQTVDGPEGRMVPMQTMEGWHSTVATLLKLGAIKQQVDLGGKVLLSKP